MKVSIVFYALKRIKALGLFGLIAAIRRRLRGKIWRLMVLYFKLQKFWILSKKVDNPPSILSLLKQGSFQLALPVEYTQDEKIVLMADGFARHVFDILGSGPMQLPPVLDWYYEFKKDNVRNPFNSTDTSFSYATYAQVFHQDVPVFSTNSNFFTYTEDIKVLWEIGRMHHLSTLGMAYGVNKDERYVQAFVGDISSFQNQVSFAYGVHWKCPMDVAIRAINLIWARHFFQEACSLQFWQKYDQMLYQHMIYLEWNFEESDKPNNHLLADYVGYFYLVAFFSEFSWANKRLDKAIELVFNGFAQQILADGTAYEGSTAYHRLDCELLLHATSLMQVLNRKNNLLEAMLAQMFEFLAVMTDHGESLVTIGDDDSGRIVFGLRNNRDLKNTPHIFPHFGIGIIRTHRIHLTLRAPVIESWQPSGHFHHDALAMTLSVNGRRLFVDPGSFVYTANVAWRNQFKASISHNTFFMQQAACKNGDLFQTELEYIMGSVALEDTRLVAKAKMINGVELSRVVECHDQEVLICDVVTKRAICTWRFVLSPLIRAEVMLGGINLFFGQDLFARIESSLNFGIKSNAGFAAGYGQFEQTKALEAIVDVEQNAIQKTRIAFYP